MTAEEFVKYIETKGDGDTILSAIAKLGFSHEFIVNNVLSSQPVTIAHIAMLWQGMPNKHDRKRTRQLFELLTQVSLLAPKGDEETWLPAATLA